VVVRRRGRSSYSSYAIRKAPQKIQIKQRSGGGGGCMLFFPSMVMGNLQKERRKIFLKKEKKKIKITLQAFQLGKC
jgi:hypothetical protein